MMLSHRHPKSSISFSGEYSDEASGHRSFRRDGEHALTIGGLPEERPVLAIRSLSAVKTSVPDSHPGPGSTFRTGVL